MLRSLALLLLSSSAALAAGHGASSTFRDGNGWTQFRATTKTAGTPCGNSSSTSNGTCIVFVDNTGGVGNDGTCAAADGSGLVTPITAVVGGVTPCATITKAMTLMRNLEPDWILLKKGDTWTNESFGGSVNLQGTGLNGLMLFGAYGPPGERPIIQVQSAIAQQCLGWVVNSTSAGNYIAVDGISFYEYDRDPNNVSFNPVVTKIGIDHGCLDWTSPLFNYVLIEDNMFNFNGNVFQKTLVTDHKLYNLIYRRNINKNVYFTQLGHASGMFINNALGVTVEENVFDHNGWNETLMSPQTVTIAAGGNITWTGNNWSNGFETGGLIFFCDSSSTPAGSACVGGDTLPTGYSHDVLYYQRDISGATFNLANGTLAGKFGNFVMGSTTVTMALSGNTTNILTGMQLYNVGVTANDAIVTSITDSTHFEISPAATATVNSLGMFFINPAITTSGSDIGTHRMSWQMSAPNVFNHNFYLHCDWTGTLFCPYYISVKGNISVEAAQDALHTIVYQNSVDNLVMKSTSAGPVSGSAGNTVSYDVTLYQSPLQAGPSAVGGRDGFDTTLETGQPNLGAVYTNNIFAHLTGGSSGYGIRYDSGVMNTSGTGNIMCDWAGNLVQDLSGNGTNSIGGTFQNAACNMGPDPTNATIEAYDLSLGGPGTYAHFMSQAELMSKDHQILGTWGPQWMAHSANNFIRGKLGVTQN